MESSSLCGKMETGNPNCGHLQLYLLIFVLIMLSHVVVSQVSSLQNAHLRITKRIPKDESIQMSSQWSQLRLQYGENTSFFEREHLGRVAIIQFGRSTTESVRGVNWLEVERATLNCYAAKKGIPLYFESFSPSSSRNLVRNRLIAVRNFLQYFEWVMFLDADSIVVNYEKHVEQFIDDRYHVILQDRDNGEVGAYFFMIRNSPLGRSFLDAWISFGSVPPQSSQQYTFKSDNKDLMELLPWVLNVDLLKINCRRFAHIIRSKSFPRFRAIQSCAKLRDVRDSQILESGSKLNKFQAPNASYFVGCIRSLIESQRNSQRHGIKIYRHAVGPVRTFEPKNIAHEQMGKPSLATSLLPSDFILHGKYLHAIVEQEDVKCAADYKGAVATDLCLNENEADEVLRNEGYR